MCKVITRQSVYYMDIHELEEALKAKFFVCPSDTSKLFFVNGHPCMSMNEVYNHINWRRGVTNTITFECHLNLNGGKAKYRSRFIRKHRERIEAANGGPIYSIYLRSLNEELWYSRSLEPFVNKVFTFCDDNIPDLSNFQVCFLHQPCWFSIPTNIDEMSVNNDAERSPSAPHPPVQEYSRSSSVSSTVSNDNLNHNSHESHAQTFSPPAARPPVREYSRSSSVSSTVSTNSSNDERPPPAARPPVREYSRSSSDSSTVSTNSSNDERPPPTTRPSSSSLNYNTPSSVMQNTTRSNVMQNTTRSNVMQNTTRSSVMRNTSCEHSPRTLDEVRRLRAAWRQTSDGDYSRSSSDRSMMLTSSLNYNTHSSVMRNTSCEHSPRTLDEVRRLRAAWRQTSDGDYSN